MYKEDEPVTPISHLESVYQFVIDTEARLLGREILMAFATRFTQRSYELLNRFALPKYRGADGMLLPGTVTTREIPIHVTPKTICVRVQADLVAGGWEDWERSWRNLGLHFQDEESESSLFIPNVGWDGRKAVPILNPDLPQSFIEFKNGLDVLSYFERRLAIT